MAPKTMLHFKKKLISQFQENVRTEGEKEGPTDPNSWGPSGHAWGSKKHVIYKICVWFDGRI